MPCQSCDSLRPWTPRVRGHDVLLAHGDRHGAAAMAPRVFGKPACPSVPCSVSPTSQPATCRRRASRAAVLCHRHPRRRQPHGRRAMHNPNENATIPAWIGHHALSHQEQNVSPFRMDRERKSPPGQRLRSNRRDPLQAARRHPKGIPHRAPEPKAVIGHAKPQSIATAASRSGLSSIQGIVNGPEGLMKAQAFAGAHGCPPAPLKHAPASGVCEMCPNRR